MCLRITAILMLTAALSACGEREEPLAVAARPTTPVITAAPRVIDANEPLRATGRLESADEIRLSFKSSGIIARINVDTGDTVQAGQVLAELDATELESVLTRSAESLRKAERDLARARELAPRGLVSREALENAVTAREMAAAESSSASFNRRFAEIRAPSAGRVLSRSAEARETVAPGTPVLSVSSETANWLLRIGVTDREVVHLGIGDQASIVFSALPQQDLAARVARIAGRADIGTGLFEVELALERGHPLLRSGMIARASIERAASGTELLVPLSALVDAGAEAATLFVVKDSHALRRTVRTGALRADGIAVLDGLTPADRVVVAGAAYLDDGQAVRESGHED